MHGELQLVIKVSLLGQDLALMPDSCKPVDIPLTPPLWMSEQLMGGRCGRGVDAGLRHCLWDRAACTDITPMSLACALQGRISLLGKLCVNAASVNTAGFILRHKTDKMCGLAWSLLRYMCS